MSPSRSRALPQRGHPRWVLVVTALGIFMTFLDATIVNVAFPSIQADFPAAGLPELSWVLNGYNAVIAAVLLPAGRLADLLGRRRVFLVGLAVFVVGSLLCGVAPSVLVLIAARVVQAIGAGMIVPASLALLLSAFDAERRAAAVALWGAAAAVAAAIGPTLGGLLVESASWRLVFLVNLPIGLGAWLVGRRVLVEHADQARGPLPDAIALVGTAGCMGLFALGIVKGNDWGWVDLRVVGAFAAALLLACLVAVRTRHHPSPVVDPAVLREASAAAANVGTLAFASGFYAMMLCNVLYLTQVWGYSTLTAGLALTPTALLAAAAAGPAGRIADRYGHGFVIVPGSLGLALAGAMFALRVETTPAYLSEWLPATVVSGLGIGLAFPALSAAAVVAIPEGRFAVASAINASARQVGAVIGVAILVAILGSEQTGVSPGSFDGGWTFVALAGLVTAPLALLAANATPSTTNTTSESARVGTQLPPVVVGRRASKGAVRDSSGS